MLNGFWSRDSLERFKAAHDNAFTDADDAYEPRPGFDESEERNDGHNDAYRHALWSATLAEEFGPDWASDYTTAHEQRPDNEATREAMDLHNNNVGIQIVRDHPNASHEEIKQLIKEAVENGDTVVVAPDGNHLAWSDQVEFGQHGHPSGGAQLPGKDPDFKTRS